MRTARILALLVLVGLLTGPVLPTPVEAGPGKSPEVLAYAENTYAILDPARLSTTQRNHERLLLVLLEPLTTLSPETGEVQPGTAESWSVSEDGRTWTFKIRADAKWDRVRKGMDFADGGPVTAHDFVRSWKRTLDPYKPSPWAALFDGIAGGREITLSSEKVDAFGRLRRALEDLVKQYPSGVPGETLNDSLDELGVRPFLGDIKGRAAQRLQDWKPTETFTPEMVETVVKAMKKARRKYKRQSDDALASFGSAASGVHAADDKTLVVKTRGLMPFLPELMARAAFAPIHKSYDDQRDKLFDDWRLYVANGPYRLKGRGVKPLLGQESARTLSVVDLERNPNYTGPNKGKMPEIFCVTDQDIQEDLVTFENGEVQQVFFTWREYPDPGDPKKPETSVRKKFEDNPGFRLHETSATAFLRFRCTGNFATKTRRRAIAMSIDRAAVAKGFWPAATPIDRIVPEGVRGRLPGVRSPSDPGGKSAVEKALAEAQIDEDLWLRLHAGDSSGEGSAMSLLGYDWKKEYGLEAGQNMQTPAELRRTIRNGAFEMLISVHRGYVNDPYAYLAQFHSANPDGGLGWEDAAFDTLIEAAADPVAALEDKDRFASKVGDASLVSALAGATSPAGRETFRRQALAKAEQRLLDEYVIVPLCVLSDGILGGRIQGLGSEAAWKNPAFVGALWNATKEGAAVRKDTPRPEPADEVQAWKEAFEPPDDLWKQAKQELVFNNGADPETIDPTKMTGVTEHTLALALYEGLVSHDPETLEPRPGVATHWAVSEDQKAYTFHLRPNAKWSNGDPVTAEDFRWTVFRCLVDPDCDYVYLFDYVDGAEAFRGEGHAETDEAYEAFKSRVGVTVEGPHTITYRLRAPTPYFLDLCAFETYMAVHRKTVQTHGKMWTRPENWVGNGPFRLAESKPRQHIVMVPNEHYWDRAFVKLTKITALPIADADTSYNKFRKNEVDWIRTVPLPKIDEAQMTPEYFVQPYLGSYFYRVNVTRPHLKDKRVRQALSLAINRETITKDVTRGGQIPADWFCPDVAGYEHATGLGYDPDKARALMKAAGYGPGGQAFPDLILLYNTQESHKMVAERLAQMWRETLGITVKLRNSEWKVYLNEVEDLNYDVARAGWIGDYGDPNTFMDMWLTAGGNNNTGWSHKPYDDLIRRASYESDPEKRYAIFREAEEILIRDEFPIIPIYIYVNLGMKRDTLRGWYENYRDLHPFQYMYFEPPEAE